MIRIGTEVRGALTIAALALMAFGAQPANAQIIPVERVTIKRNEPPKKIEGILAGPDLDVRDYAIRGKEGQMLQVELDTENPAIYFEVLRSGNAFAMVKSSVTGRPQWAGTFPIDGDYTVRVYMARNAAHRAERAGFSLNVAIATLPQAADEK